MPLADVVSMAEDAPVVLNSWYEVEKPAFSWFSLMVVPTGQGAAPPPVQAVGPWAGS